MHLYIHLQVILLNALEFIIFKLVTFTFSDFADAFIQSDLQLGDT